MITYRKCKRLRKIIFYYSKKCNTRNCKLYKSCVMRLETAGKLKMEKTIKCEDVERHFKSLWKWDIKDYVTDGFKAGRKNNEAGKIGVMWKARLGDIKKAHDDGCNFIICHESIAVKTLNSSKEPERSFALEEEREKFAFMERHDMTVYRCHDLWDRMEKVGVRDTWRALLFAEGEIAASSYPYYVTKLPPLTLYELAGKILEKIKPLGQDGVLVSGDGSKKVSKIATGTGVCTDTAAMKRLGADAAVITDDYYLFVRQGVLSEEMGFPTIMVNHNVAEELAIKNLYEYIKSVFPSVETLYYRQKCPYQIIT